MCCMKENGVSREDFQRSDSGAESWRDSYHQVKKVKRTISQRKWQCTMWEAYASTKWQCIIWDTRGHFSLAKQLFLQIWMWMSLDSATTHHTLYLSPAGHGTPLSLSPLARHIAGKGEPGEGNWPGHRSSWEEGIYCWCWTPQSALARGKTGKAKITKRIRKTSPAAV